MRKGDKVRVKRSGLSGKIIDDLRPRRVVSTGDMSPDPSVGLLVELDDGVRVLYSEAELGYEGWR